MIRLPYPRRLLCAFWQGKGPDWHELYKRGQLHADLRHALQRYAVGLPPWEFSKARTLIVSELRRDTGIWIASDAGYLLTSRDCKYAPNCGLLAT